MSQPEPLPTSQHPATPSIADRTRLRRRALAVWPRLEPAGLRRAGEDPERVADLVERRSALPRESILAILRAPEVSEDEVSTWFG